MYRYSQCDSSNIKWFCNDNSVQSLVGIRLVEGHIRGLYPFHVSMSYPITAIAGLNGSGKSTLLEIAACAFHNSPRGYKPDDRHLNYYTFSDFFMQTRDETPPDGIRIYYTIRYDNWHGKEPGPANQLRKKPLGGKWNDYSKRVSRNVIYFGTLRVVPPNELKTYKSYCRYFTKTTLDKAISEKICEIAGRITGKYYSEFHTYNHTKFAMPAVINNGNTHTSFNLGAGEKAVFNILYSLFSAGKGCLLIIDEIELGLHAQAQNRLIVELKSLCLQLHCQIICSTHSHVVLESLPPEGRFFIENCGGSTNIINGISSEYACGKFTGKSSSELSIFVEDNFARSIIQSIIQQDIRDRVDIFPIGSDESVLHQVASRYREKRYDFIAILDGDKSRNNLSNVRKIVSFLGANLPCDKDKFDEDLARRLRYLPGSRWPEKELMDELSSNQDCIAKLSENWTAPQNVIQAYITSCLSCSPHSEFFTLSQYLKLDVQNVVADIVRAVHKYNQNYYRNIVESVSSLLA